MDSTHIRRSYENPRVVGALRGISGFAQNRKGQRLPTKTKDAIRQLESYSLFKPSRVRFPTRPMIVQNAKMFFSCDLAEFSKSQKYQNSHFRYLLVFIDTFSKMVWLRALKSKSGADVSHALDGILKSLKLTQPAFVHVDNGVEFFNSQTSAVLKKYNVKAYATFSGKKSFIAENKIRFIKRILERLYYTTGKKNWVSYLPILERNLNESYHRSIQMTPKRASIPSMQGEVFYNLYKSYFMKPIKRPALAVGQLVRISNQRRSTIFDKKYKESFSRELFKIHKIKTTFPVVSYQLVDSKGQLYPGSWTNLELLKQDGPLPE